MNSKVRIVTDSVADIPWDLVHRLRIAVVPIPLLIEGRSYLADASLNLAWVYDTLTRTPEKLTTAAPPPTTFLETFRRLAAEGAQEIVALFTPASLSSITNNARIAARKLQKVRVHFAEARQVTMGLGWQAIAAAEAAAQGRTAEEIIAMIETMHPRTLVLGILDTLQHLHRSGRVAWVAGHIVRLLRIKPVIAFYEGEATLISRVRTHRRALAYMVTRIRKATPLERLAILHSGASDEEIAHLSQQLLPIAPQQPIPVVQIGPIFSTHIGPRALGAALVSHNIIA